MFVFLSQIKAFTLYVKQFFFDNNYIPFIILETKSCIISHFHIIYVVLQLLHLIPKILPNKKQSLKQTVRVSFTDKFCLRCWMCMCKSCCSLLIEGSNSLNHCLMQHQVTSPVLLLLQNSAPRTF